MASCRHFLERYGPVLVSGKGLERQGEGHEAYADTRDNGCDACGMRTHAAAATAADLRQRAAAAGRPAVPAATAAAATATGDLPGRHGGPVGPGLPAAAASATPAAAAAARRRARLSRQEGACHWVGALFLIDGPDTGGTIAPARSFVTGAELTSGICMQTPNIIERAFQLAPSLSSVEQIRKALRQEGYSNVDAHLQGASIKADLKKRFVR
jgi:hypothetical protein